MPAEVTVVVTRFVENSATTPPKKPEENCTIQAELRMNGDKGGRWKSDPDGEVFLCPKPDLGTIAVKRRPGRDGPVLVTFRIASEPGVPELRPTDIAFEQLAFRFAPAKERRDPDGKVNFGPPTIAGDTLTVPNRWIHKGRSLNRATHDAPHWKFWLRVQAADGRLGWIDPTIENSEDMQP